MVTPVWDASLFIETFCERRSASFLDEPLNQATNLVFLLACLLLVRRVVQLRGAGHAVPFSVQALVASIGAVAISSAVFHMSALRWAGVSDAMAVRLFAMAFAACYMRWLLNWPWHWVAVVIPALLSVALVVPGALPLSGLYGVAPLLPGALGLVLFAAILALRGDPAWRVIAAAAASFAVAMVFHRADRPLCEMLPTGTHFLWHLFSGIAAYLMASAVLERAVQRPQRTPPPQLTAVVP
ncbi:MAG: hypothetical protein MUC86_05810 [Burkholderiaceae bacterium]|jgi:hypothetical protein|nr:hypothetical protein [Burkholderiaceae bacterium]